MRSTLAACASLLVASNAMAALEKWGPTWSEVTGAQWSKTQMNRTAAVISQVDGKSQTNRIVKAEPGRRSIVVRSPMRSGFAGSDVTVDLELEACKRYYVNAQFEGGVGTDWKPVIAKVEPIAGCKRPA